MFTDNDDDYINIKHSENFHHALSDKFNFWET